MKSEADQLQQLITEKDIQQILIRYAEALDSKNWDGLDNVFHPDVQVNYADVFQLDGRDTAVNMIKSMLETCGPTQHLLGNYRINPDGDQAESACYVRAVHAGRGLLSFFTFTIWAEYIDRLVLTDEGWRIIERNLKIAKRTGNLLAMGTGLWKYYIKYKSKRKLI